MTVKKIFIVSVLSIIFCYAMTILFIVGYGLHDSIHTADVGVILGNQVHRNGTPSQRLRARLNTGIQLYQRGVIKNIIVSGGINRYRIGEGTAMKNYLLSHGIPASRIIVDNKGSNTWHTALDTKKIMEQRHFDSVIAISQYYHIARTVFALRRCGISPVYHAHAHYVEQLDFYFVPREAVAIYYYFFFHHIS